MSQPMTNSNLQSNSNLKTNNNLLQNDTLFKSIYESLQNNSIEGNITFTYTLIFFFNQI